MMVFRGMATSMWDLYVLRHYILHPLEKHSYLFLTVLSYYSVDMVYLYYLYIDEKISDEHQVM